MFRVYWAVINIAKSRYSLLIYNVLVSYSAILKKKQMTKKTKQENAYAVNTMITLTQSQMIGKLCNIFFTVLVSMNSFTLLKTIYFFFF